jgi:hypothetical protein
MSLPKWRVGTFFVEDGVDQVMEDRRKRAALLVCIIAVIIVTVFLTLDAKILMACGASWKRFLMKLFQLQTGC